jgi:hypothetical protein
MDVLRSAYRVVIQQPPLFRAVPADNRSIQVRKGWCSLTQLGRLIASFTVVTLFCWVVRYFLPVWLNAAVLGLLIAFVVVAGFVKLVLIMLTRPPR